MSIKTIQQYATEKNTSQQNVRQSKTLPIQELGIYAFLNGEYIYVGKQKFIVEK